MYVYVFPRFCCCALLFLTRLRPDAPCFFVAVCALPPASLCAPSFLQLQLHGDDRVQVGRARGPQASPRKEANFHRDQGNVSGVSSSLFSPFWPDVVQGIDALLGFFSHGVMHRLVLIGLNIAHISTDSEGLACPSTACLPWLRTEKKQKQKWSRAC